MRYTWETYGNIHRRAILKEYLRLPMSTYWIRRVAPKGIGLNFRVCYCNHQQAQKSDTIYLDGNILRGIPRPLNQTDIKSNNPSGCDLLKISSANNQRIFALRILEVYLEGVGVMVKEEEFPFLHLVLKPGKELSLKICSRSLLRDEQFCMIRFGYKDVSGTEYYQDLPLCFFSWFDSGRKIPSLRIIEIQKPVLLPLNNR